jgi:hypothetical protein
LSGKGSPRGAQGLVVVKVGVNVSKISLLSHRKMIEGAREIIRGQGCRTNQKIDFACNPITVHTSHAPVPKVLAHESLCQFGFLLDCIFLYSIF